MDKVTYYVLRDNEENPKVLVKYEDGDFYGYEDGDWEYNPAYSKILEEDTDYEEVSEEEAEKIADYLDD